MLYSCHGCQCQGVTKRIGKTMHELAAKVDEYTRGMIGPLGATLFEELGLYYIGPVDGHNIDDLICVLNEVATLDSTGPVLVHVITEDEDLESIQKVSNDQALILCMFSLNYQWRPILLPDNYIEQATPREQLEIAGLTGHHIAATTLSLLGRHREAFLLMR
ncbi:hypothetical protein B296_00010721 [Ensete ventricosum]|uniref:Transketolase signature 1 domain-containing protein n=1 Tax=Ensete ventricosum TaxID=4639 RepID=A0A426ZTF0_ENSVE|nr:hypothetical protein B296_00010721 [Ensete ventricosum]